jgi:hypothetical protein
MASLFELGNLDTSPFRCQWSTSGRGEQLSSNQLKLPTGTELGNKLG